MVIYKINKYSLRLVISRCFSTKYNQFKPPWKVLFFGTDRFSLASLEALNSEYKKRTVIDKLEVVTSFKNKSNAVYKYGTAENLVLHRWPLEENIKDFDIGLVVSFGYLLPELLIKSFPLGMLNVHASLLPRWRGAAPIVYALANGDTKTGVTIMRIKPKHFDIGEIIDQEEHRISNDVTMPVLYKTLADLGARTLLKSLQNLPENLSKALPQHNEGVTYAPKIDQNFGIVDFCRMSAIQVYNLGRALDTLYPLLVKFNELPIKLYGVELSTFESDGKLPGYVCYDKKDASLKVRCCDGNYVSVKNVGVINKRTMSAIDFNNGYLKKQIESNRVFR